MLGQSLVMIAWRWPRKNLLPRHREPPLGGVAIQGHRTASAAALDCFVAKPLLAMTLSSPQSL
jgi:hypothetical protein